MACLIVNISPIERLDREQTLMDRLVDESPVGLDAEYQAFSLLGAVGETISLINSGDHAHVIYQKTVHANLLVLLVAAAGLARQFDITLYHGDVWPDECRTRIGGDGALAIGHDPQHLLGELLEAAGWVAEWVHNRSKPVVDDVAPARRAPAWNAAEPVTELIARIWCLADRLDAREPVRALVNEHLSDQSDEQSRSSTA